MFIKIRLSRERVRRGHVTRRLSFYNIVLQIFYFYFGLKNILFSGNVSSSISSKNKNIEKYLGLILADK